MLLGRLREEHGSTVVRLKEALPGPYTLTFGPEDEPSLVLERVRFP